MPPARLLALVRWTATRGRLAVLLSSRRTSTISVGVGAGLRFNAGSSNPDYASGDNELPVQQALARYLRPGCVFFDVGANVGFLAVIGAKLVGPDGAVYAFEPVPNNAAFVRRNAELNEFRNISVIEKAISSTSGRMALALAEYSGGAALSSVAAPPDFKGTISVDVVSIDDLIFQEGLSPPAVVKVDVEGAELEVLSGMPETLRKYKPVIIYELDDHDAALLSRKQGACEAFLHSMGYQVTTLEDSYPGIRWLVKHFVATPT